jgi:FMN phosphatase YigB (HAD superfamily)
VIKTILFDLGGVIVPFDFKRAYSRMAPLLSYPVAEVAIRLRATDLIQRFETGLVAPERFVEEVCAVLEMKRIAYEEFCDLWTSVFMVETLIPESLVARLGSRYRLLLSNTNPIHFNMIKENYPLLRHFDDYVLSYEVGALKPSAKIYQEAVARAGCGAQECFFTDDILMNVEAARQHGMDAVQFQTAAQLEEELRVRGLL